MIDQIKNLESRYIPVSRMDYHDKKLEWWHKDSYFYYPYLLINLMQFKDHKTTHNIPEDAFLLNDSGGFQVISGTCNYDWKDSLLQQIKIGSSRIFAFDKPPVRKKSQESNAAFVEDFDDEMRRKIEENLDVAIEQSKYLKENYPDKVKIFFYVMHGSTKEMLDYNLELIEKKIGLANYSDYFGGACYGSKVDDKIGFTTCLLHANFHFIKKDLPVHFLGVGSPLRFILLVRNKITTFDSGTALTGAMYWTWANQINLVGAKGLIGAFNRENFPFKKSPCNCPICKDRDWNELLEEDKVAKLGEYIVVHNLYQLIKLNIFLDSINLNQYTETMNNFFNLPKDVALSLEYCDYADEVGFEMAYEKYRHYHKSDSTKQHTLF